MQSFPLTINKFLDHAAKWWPLREVVTADAGRPVSRVGYAELRARANRMSGALAVLGLEPGERIGTLAWNTQQHLEIYYASMGSGRVCHTLNPRLTAAQIAAMINEASDKVLAAAHDLQPLVAEVARLCPGLKHILFLDGEPAPEAIVGVDADLWTYEGLLKTHGTPVAWGGFDEEAPAGLCYTSGTTGRPKGVLYTHRSNYLHTLHALQADAFALSGRDCLLLATPMFHANGWGFPFAAPTVGAKLVLPGRRTDGASLARLMREERVTVAAGVQTVWLALVDHLDVEGRDLVDIERLIIGGSNCPEAQIQRIEDRLGVQVQATWGMTELSPLGVVVPPRSKPADRRASGRPPLGVDLKLTDADGAALDPQRNQVGRLKVKGASVMDRYFNAEHEVLDEEGFFDTGDLASLDDEGNLTICGRAKDLIKSGGEWINPVEIEEIVGRHFAVGQVAVIGRYDRKWGERPLLVVELRHGQTVLDEDLIETLRGKVATWWLPDLVVRVQSMPLAATGKIDKMRLRAEHAGREEP